jgi:hypothetical protein
VTGRIRYIEKINSLVGNRTHELLVCSIVPQSTILPRAPFKQIILINSDKSSV